jgi:hypothetical protein
MERGRVGVKKERPGEYRSGRFMSPTVMSLIDRTENSGNA